MKLPPLPSSFAATRDALHQIAFFVLAPLRYEAVGRMGLRPTPGGFGTPEFDGKVARVDGGLLVFEEGDKIATRTITTVREASAFFGLDYEVDWFEDFGDPLEPWAPDQPLEVDPESARVLAHWFVYGFELLNRLRSHADSGDDASEPQLWPEHFDAAIEMGSEEEGRRASYGASPGDRDHSQPYLYVSAWGEIDRSNRYWNDEAFNGSSFPYPRLVEADDSVEAGVDFLIAGYRILSRDR
jgi:hypothetical protein